MCGNRFRRWQAVQRRITANDPKQRLRQEVRLHRTSYSLSRPFYIPALLSSRYPILKQFKKTQQKSLQASANSIQCLKTHLVLRKTSENFSSTLSLPSGWGKTVGQRQISTSYNTSCSCDWCRAQTPGSVLGSCLCSKYFRSRFTDTTDCRSPRLAWRQPVVTHFLVSSLSVICI